MPVCRCNIWKAPAQAVTFGSLSPEQSAAVCAVHRGGGAACAVAGAGGRAGRGGFPGDAACVAHTRRAPHVWCHITCAACLTKLQQSCGCAVVCVLTQLSARLEASFSQALASSAGALEPGWTRQWLNSAGGVLPGVLDASVNYCDTWGFERRPAQSTFRHWPRRWRRPPPSRLEHSSSPKVPHTPFIGTFFFLSACQRRKAMDTFNVQGCVAAVTASS